MDNTVGCLPLPLLIPLDQCKPLQNTVEKYIDFSPPIQQILQSLPSFSVETNIVTSVIAQSSSLSYNISTTKLEQSKNYLKPQEINGQSILLPMNLSRPSSIHDFKALPLRYPTDQKITKLLQLKNKNKGNGATVHSFSLWNTHKKDTESTQSPPLTPPAESNSEPKSTSNLDEEAIPVIDSDEYDSDFNDDTTSDAMLDLPHAADMSQSDAPVFRASFDTSHESPARSDTSETCLIDNRWSKGEKIGEGSFGTVYRALDQMSGRTVALKQIDLSAPVVKLLDLIVSSAKLHRSLSMDEVNGISVRNSSPNIHDRDEGKAEDSEGQNGLSKTKRRRSDTSRLAALLGLRSRLSESITIDAPSFDTSNLCTTPESTAGSAISAIRLQRQNSCQSAECIDGSDDGSVSVDDDNSQQLAKEVCQLEKEILVLKTLKHKNIVRYIGCCRESDKFYLLLEFVPGGSVASMISQFGKFSESLVKRYAKQMLAGVQYLHSRGVVHRDIKGGNVLVSDLGIVKLTDFGCSKQLQSVCSSSLDVSLELVHGSTAWMAPEYMWSVGMTIIEMVTGRRPFPDFSSNLSLMYHLSKLSSVEGIIPTSVSDVLRSLLLNCIKIVSSERCDCLELMKHEFWNLSEADDDCTSVCPSVSSQSARIMPTMQLKDKDMLFASSPKSSVKLSGKKTMIISSSAAKIKPRTPNKSKISVCTSATSLNNSMSPQSRSSGIKSVDSSGRRPAPHIKGLKPKPNDARSPSPLRSRTCRADQVNVEASPLSESRKSLSCGATSAPLPSLTSMTQKPVDT